MPFDRHSVFLTEHEVVFVFEAPGEAATLSFPGEDPALWKAAAAWAECMAARPRKAETAYSWERGCEPEGVTYAATPGPGDSEGGDLFEPSADTGLAGEPGRERADEVGDSGG